MPGPDEREVRQSPARGEIRGGKSGVSSSFWGKSAVSSSFLPEKTGNPLSVHHSCPKRRTDIAQEARERRIVTTVKPFAGTLRVTNPARKSRASSRKRVLHDGGQPPL